MIGAGVCRESHHFLVFPLIGGDSFTLWQTSDCGTVIGVVKNQLSAFFVDCFDVPRIDRHTA